MAGTYTHGREDTAKPPPPPDVSTQELPFLCNVAKLLVDMNVDGAGAAKRRRERRLRAMLRHERQTVAMELAAALHHSRDGGRVTHCGLRAPETASSGGWRPGVLKEPEPPNVVDRVLRRTVGQIVFSLGNDLSSVEAWFSTALDIEEVLAGTGGDPLHVSWLLM